MNDVLRERNSVEYPFYHLVPKERVANLEYRKQLLTRCAKDPAFRQATWIACKRDTLYFFNAFVWLYEPRPGMPCGTGKIPFITWPHQDRAINVLDLDWGMSDIKFWKTRGEGATWLVCMRVLKDWIFDDRWNPGAFGLVTRNEQTVDSPDDPDSLMWKLDWELKQLPSWMVPGPGDISRKVSEHTLKNKRNDATIVGYAASEDVGSGGRKRVFMMDELAKFAVMRKGADYAAMSSTFPVTNCRVVVSTPKGTANAYYDAIMEDVDVDSFNVTARALTDEDHEALNEKGVVVLHWSDNPIRNRGLYFCAEDGTIRDVDREKFGALSQEYREAWPRIRQSLERKGFRVVGTMRSPWYDRQCLRANATPQSIAQELDLDFGGSGFTIFKTAIGVAHKTIRRPLAEMEVDYDQSTLEPQFIERRGGTLKVWEPMLPDTRKPASHNTYILGADIASGLGGSTHSNSVAEVINLENGEQVAEWANNAAEPYEFADICIALAKFFNGAEIIHEANGPYGRYFTKRLLERGYGNIYRRREYGKSSEKRTKEYGWGSQQDTKPAMLEDLARKIRAGLIKCHSKELVDELKNWVMADGKVVHSKASNTDDDSSKGAAHGDRVVALGVAAMRYDIDVDVPKEVREEDFIQRANPHPDTMAFRLREYDRSLAESSAIDW